MSSSPRPTPFLTSREAAELLHVAPSSVKRWALAGELRCETTAGGHRRFARADVEAFARRGRPAPERAPADSATTLLVEALISNRPGWTIQAMLVERRARAASWHETADALAGVCAEIGECWARGRISILDEHRATERFARALAACAETLVVSETAPRALLATADGDEHTLALHLAEICLREAGWNVEWSGRRTPTPELVARVERGGIGLVALSASVCSNDERVLEAQVERLRAACRVARAELVLGGSGAWPAIDASAGDDVLRVRSFGELHRFLAGTASRTP